MDRIDEWVDAELFVDRLMARLTDMQGGVCLLIMADYTVAEIAIHFELSEDAVYAYLAAVKGKAERLKREESNQYRLPLRPGKENAV